MTKGKIDNTDQNREKFYAGLWFQAGNEIAQFQTERNDFSTKPERIVYIKGGTKQAIRSITDHSFSFVFSYFGQVNLITVFFSELVFIPEDGPQDPGDDYEDSNFLISNQI